MRGDGGGGGGGVGVSGVGGGGGFTVVVGRFGRFGRSVGRSVQVAAVAATATATATATAAAAAAAGGCARVRAYDGMRGKLGLRGAAAAWHRERVARYRPIREAIFCYSPIRAQHTLYASTALHATHSTYGPTYV